MATGPLTRASRPTVGATWRRPASTRYPADASAWQAGSCVAGRMDRRSSGKLASLSRRRSPVRPRYGLRRVPDASGQRIGGRCACLPMSAGTRDAAVAHQVEPLASNQTDGVRVSAAAPFRGTLLAGYPRFERGPRRFDSCPRSAGPARRELESVVFEVGWRCAPPSEHRGSQRPSDRPYPGARDGIGIHAGLKPRCRKA